MRKERVLGLIRWRRQGLPGIQSSRKGLRCFPQLCLFSRVEMSYLMANSRVLQMLHHFPQSSNNKSRRSRVWCSASHIKSSRWKGNSLGARHVAERISTSWRPNSTGIPTWWACTRARLSKRQSMSLLSCSTLAQAKTLNISTKSRIVVSNDRPLRANRKPQYRQPRTKITDRKSCSTSQVVINIWRSPQTETITSRVTRNLGDSSLSSKRAQRSCLLNSTRIGGKIK